MANANYLRQNRAAVPCPFIESDRLDTLVGFVLGSEATEGRSHELRRGGVGASAMFCNACGKEIPNQGRFCCHCGVELGSAADSPGLPPAIAAPSQPRHEGVQAVPRRYSLRGLHTLNWRGTCPSCKLVHTVHNTPCGNDQAPLAVAFDDHRFVFHRYPIYAATLRCLEDCGFHANAFPCTRCGAVIAVRNIQFRFGRLSRISHLLCHALIMATCGVLALITLAKPNVVTPFALLICSLFALCLRPFGRFTFADVSRAAKKYAKELSRTEAIRSARAVESDRKFREGFSIDGMVDAFTGKK
jgi:hypothetical protein